MKVVTSDDAILYSCPVREQEVLITKKGALKVKKGDTISSTQAEGIFNKVEDIATVGMLIFLRKY